MREDILKYMKEGYGLKNKESESREPLKPTDWLGREKSRSLERFDKWVNERIRKMTKESFDEVDDDLTYYDISASERSICEGIEISQCRESEEKNRIFSYIILIKETTIYLVINLWR